ncbi:MAG: regulator of amino acid metabolism, contains ACT domain protein [Methanoregulaceae archaeon]|nr:regulator of amino acid metabolism, contains ACT domain protein [Methanoregulaceae archaeon]
MWSDIIREFAESPSQSKVAGFLLENGFGVNAEGRVVCNDIEISATKVAKAIGTDRRVVDATARHILESASLREIFTNMRATPDLSLLAGPLGLSVITIIPKDAREKGIIGAAMEVVTGHNLNIRQIFVTDPVLSEEPKLVIIIDGNIPGIVIEEIKKLPQVKQVIL